MQSRIGTSPGERLLHPNAHSVVARCLRLALPWARVCKCECFPLILVRHCCHTQRPVRHVPTGLLLTDAIMREETFRRCSTVPPAHIGGAHHCSRPSAPPPETRVPAAEPLVSTSAAVWPLGHVSAGTGSSATGEVSDHFWRPPRLTERAFLTEHASMGLRHRPSAFQGWLPLRWGRVLRVQVSVGPVLSTGLAAYS